MKIILAVILVLNSYLFCAENKNDIERKEMLEKQIQKEIKREEEYAKNQGFYIDLKDAEVNEKSLSNIPVMELDDLDMDSVYD